MLHRCKMGKPEQTIPYDRVLIKSVDLVKDVEEDYWLF